MRTIYKYQLELAEHIQPIQMPVAADLLHAEMQGCVPLIWAMVDPDAPETTRAFRLIGTGWPIGEDETRLDHISTVRDREFVWHIFEVFTP